ncbi:hypothetical protein LX32DRAFT_327226 [Colletotrichum zoysiae]|uniref:Uncharacterized protein n=1 Tax=Colletotrichum zoysiae TaxID=1216348 RepID=A0AAD9LT95_9PEZI|nr:hypothetical protein LX32DRAFT_327226 [Colletotrichum zoysiae]
MAPHAPTNTTGRYGIPVIVLLSWSTMAPLGLGSRFTLKTTSIGKGRVPVGLKLCREISEAVDSVASAIGRWRSKPSRATGRIKERGPVVAGKTFAKTLLFPCLWKDGS